MLPLLGAVSLLAMLSSARSADYYVEPSDANAFPTVQAAVDAVSGQSELNRANIFIAPGTYHEIVTVDKPYVSFIGTGSSSDQTTISFSRAYVAGGFDSGEIVRIQDTAVAFMARNLTFENSLPDKNISPGLAVRSSADRVIFDNVRVLGYQDTLLVDGWSRQYFRDSFVTGDSDFIFGDATVVFDHCTIESTDAGWVTAADTNRATANGFVFLDCSLVPGHDRNLVGGDNTFGRSPVYLGRPWLWWEPETMSSVIFIRTKMGPHIISAGWDPWNDPGVPGANSNADRDPLTRFSEFGSMDLSGNLLADNNGDGTPNGRVPWTDPMTEDQAANYTLEHIFGPVSFWDSTTQPQASGTVYESQGDPWNPIAQLALLPTQAGAPSQALNVSTRLGVETGDNVLIAGFIITGATSKQLLLRAMGPSLTTADVDDPLADPVLELLDSTGTRIAFNNSWRYSQEADIIATGIPPTDDHEAAILVTLSPGTYTAIVRGRHQSTGVALVEAYDLSGSNGSQLSNISTRGFITPGGGVMIAGFILAGGTGGAEVIVRAIGPSLTAAGIAQPLNDPTLELHDGNGVTIAFNDNWRDTQQAEIEATGVPPTNDREAAIFAALPPGSYTAVIADRNGAGGIGVVEVFCLGF
ncbi:MAG TPA: pectinesterase family protein [Chthoniobacterales bacterium]|nr:pectinesterase family protein [Chthoniobacterales bacterium]